MHYLSSFAVIDILGPAIFYLFIYLFRVDILFRSLYYLRFLFFYKFLKKLSVPFKFSIRRIPSLIPLLLLPTLSACTAISQPFSPEKERNLYMLRCLLSRNEKHAEKKPFHGHHNVFELSTESYVFLKENVLIIIIKCSYIFKSVYRTYSIKYFYSMINLKNKF